MIIADAVLYSIIQNDTAISTSASSSANDTATAALVNAAVDATIYQTVANSNPIQSIRWQGASVAAADVARVMTGHR